MKEEEKKESIEWKTAGYLEIFHSLGGHQASLKVFCAYERRSDENVPAEEIECNRWSYTDLDEKCQQKFDVWDSVPASGTHGSCRLISSGGHPILFQWNSFQHKTVNSYSRIWVLHPVFLAYNENGIPKSQQNVLSKRQ